MSFRITSALIATLLLSSFSWADRPLDIETAARAFRIRVYNNFRQKRAEYDTRIAAGAEVLSAWTGGGTEAEQQDVLMWFLAASEASTQETERALPELTVMETLNSRRTPAFKNLQLTAKKKQVRQQARANQQPAPHQPGPPTTKSNGGSGLAGMFGQMVNQGVDRMFGKGTPATVPPSRNESVANGSHQFETTENSPVESGSGASTIGSSTTNAAELTKIDAASEEALLALQPEVVAEADSYQDDVPQVQHINETISGHNLAIANFREQLSSEWDFDPKSADELVTKLESMAANELHITEQVASLMSTAHSQIVPIESVNSLLGEMSERLEALNDGRETFAASGFDASDAQALFDRVENIRSDLGF